MGPLKIFTSRIQTMKHSIFHKLAVLTLLAAVTVTGCATKKPKDITPISGLPTRVDPKTPQDLTGLKNPPPTTPPLDTIPPGGLGGTPTSPIRSTPVPVTSVPPEFPPTNPITPIGAGGGNAADPQLFDNMIMERGTFAANTIHFDYDKSIVKASEVGKLQPVIAALKASPQNKLLIEGHCDERGTEEYNRALGERRALAIRERLAKAGISPDRLRTLSYGEDKPLELGHTEAAWAKNRRGELVLLKPKN